MAQSACPKCSRHVFELKEVTPAGSQFKLTFVQCSSCGTVVGVIDFYNIPKLLDKIAKKLGVNIFA